MLKSLPSRKTILQHFDENDLVMAGVIRQVGEFRLGRNKNYFLVLCKSIIAQQISTKAAESITRRFEDLLEDVRATPDRVKNLTDVGLRSVGLSSQKIRYMKDLSEKFLDGTIRPHRMHYLDNEEIIQQLTQVYGIGRWTAEMFLIFSLNRMNVLPVGDLGFRSGLKQIYSMRALPSPERMRVFGKKWHPYETVGTWYTWRVIDGENIAY